MAEDLPYVLADGRAMAGTLYRPAGQGPAPYVIDVHGGAWVSGGRLDNAGVQQQLADAGIGVYAIDFRMPPQARFPASVREVNGAIRWFRANAAGLGLQVSSLGGVGWSSGGHQLMLSVLKPDDAEWATGQGSAALDFVVLCWAILDPLARYRMAKARAIANLVAAHLAFWPDDAAMGRANPQAILDRAEAVLTPPALVIQGTADANVDHMQATAFAEAYRRAGGAIAVMKFEGAPHGFIKRDPDAEESRAAVEAIVKFIKTAAS